MTPASRKEKPVPVGQIALHQALGMKIPPPAVQSFVASGARRCIIGETAVEERYPLRYKTDGSLQGDLRFAFRHEPLDLRVIHAALTALGAETLTDWARSEPTGGFSRRVWFLYERLTGRTLDVEPVKRGNYVDALDEKLHFTATPVNSPRHRVRDNLLGTAELCPTVRRTPKLTAMSHAQMDREAQALASRYAPQTFARAANFLYTKETRSSFAIEGEAPGRDREERFLQALRQAPFLNLSDKDEILRLQGMIVDPRYAANDWRDVQNFVGETTRRYGESVHFICPRPADVPALMQGWIALTERLLASPVDPVVAAAVSAFAFVFIHPFEDGNGRLHRYLLHAILSKRGFCPADAIFPVSAAILRRRSLYDKALEAFSKPMLPAIEWDFAEEGVLKVRNDTRDLYRFFDATAQAEYLYERVEETIRVDFKEELDFLTLFDAAFAAVLSIVDMPDRRASLLARLCLQNGGRLSENKRRQFEELTEEEIERMERAVQSAMEGA